MKVERMKNQFQVLKNQEDLQLMLNICQLIDGKLKFPKTILKILKSTPKSMKSIFVTCITHRISKSGIFTIT